MTLLEALMGTAFDRLNWQYSGEFDQNFSIKSNAPRVSPGGIGGFQLQIALKKQERYSKKKKVAPGREIRKVALRTKSCSKSEKLLKSCRATYVQPYRQHTLLDFSQTKLSRIYSFKPIVTYWVLVKL